MRDSLIITLVNHSNFGYLLQPMFVVFQPDIDVYTFTETALTTSPTYKELTEDEQAIVRLAELYSDKSLMVAYSREKNEADFLRKVTENDINNNIRPFIEKRLKEISELLLKIGTPVFIREKIQVRDFRPHQSVEVLREPSKMVFIFRNKETFTYSAKIQNGESEIDLYGQFFAPLVSSTAIVVIGRQLHYFNDVDVKKLIPFFNKKQIEVPPGSVPGYIRKFVLQCVKNFETIGEGLNIFKQEYKPVAILSLEKSLDLVPVLSLAFRYGNNLFSISKPFLKEVELIEEENDIAIGWYYRDKDWEENQIHKLINAGLRKTRTSQFVTEAMINNNDDTLGVVEWLNQNRALLEDFELRQSFGKLLYYTGEIDLSIDAGSGHDWFDIRCTACFGDVRIPFVKFKDYILNGIREYVLPDGRIAVLPKEWFTRFPEMFRYGKVSGDRILLAKYHFLVKELAENGRFPDNGKDAVALKDIEILESLNATLRPYQKLGFHWLAYLHENGFGGCLADDMGLGKTLQTITLLLHVYTKVSDAPPSLIVMPTSLIHNWLSELGKFAPLLKVYVHSGSNRFREEEFAKSVSGYQIILTTYGIVRQDIHFLSDYPFHYLILDESQYIKNPSSQAFSSVGQLLAAHKLTLTGTPIENSLSDLWAQMDFLNNGILGKHSEFKMRFREADVVTVEEKRQMLLKIIDPFILRRTKEEVAPELPPLTDEVVYCEMDDAQALLYDEEKNKARNMLLEHSDDTNRMFSAFALSSLMRLRLLANHPAISIPGYKNNSAKSEQIVALAEVLFSENHKVLIFSSFVKHLQIIANYFDERGWLYAWLTGSTVDRETEINRFNSDKDVRAFFISLKAGGTGLNLTAADYVFIIDPWWNPAAEMQAVSRAHRIGQDKKVTLYRFITKGTVEEKIQRLQRYKKALTDALVKPKLSVEEMQELLE